MKLVARLLVALWFAAAVAAPVSLWPAVAVAEVGEDDECGDDSDDVDPPSDEPDEPADEE